MPINSSRRKKWLTTLKFFAAYLVAAWTFLQFVDWILNRYDISPYWVDILLWLFIGIIPSLLIYLYHQERLNKRILKLREKIVFPLNVVFIGVGLYFGFGTSDLGATTKNIDYEDENGDMQHIKITKEEFRTAFPIFNFKPKTKDSTIAWLEFGISILLYEDLLQNKNFSPDVKGFDNTSEKVREAGYFYDFYIDGEFEVIDSIYTIKTFLRNSSNAKILTQETFTGNNVLSLIDDMTVFVTNYFSSKEFNTTKYIDLNVEEFTSNSLKALEYYRYGDYENAIKEDSTFALAYLTAGKLNLNFNLSKLEERKLAEKAFENRYKLPLQKRGETLILRNLAYDRFEDAEELVKLQLEVDPSDESYNRILYNIYGRSKNLKAYTERAYNAWGREKNTTNGYAYLEACLINEDYDKIIRDVNTLNALSPNDDYIFTLNLRPQLLKGNIEAAIKIQDKAKLLHPDLENLTKVYDTAIAYLKDHKPTKKDLKSFEGVYRANNNEQTYTNWVEKNILLQYVSNQTISVPIMAGDNRIVFGDMASGRTWITEFFANDSGEFYLLKMEQNDAENTLVVWQWKIDDTIKAAETLLETKELDSAEIYYKKAIKTNPKHYYLKDALAHINYVKTIDSLELQNQFNDVVGTYGPRKFWVDQGKLFYKRDNLPKIELLPISKDRYISMTKLGTNMAFEYINGKPKTSFSYQYNVSKEEWIKSEAASNIFAKD